MVDKIFKRFLVAIWEYLAKRRLLNKFKLYGSYKQLYSWDQYHHIREHFELFKPLNYKINPTWYKFFTLVRQKEDPAYLPEDIWHIRLEPVLNDGSYAKGFNDKNLYDLKEYKDLLP